MLLLESSFNAINEYNRVMTDNTSSLPPSPSTGGPAERPPETAKPIKPARKGSALSTALIIVLLLAIGLGAALWNLRQQSAKNGREVAARLDRLSGDLLQARNDVREALSLAQAQSGRVADLEGKVRETQSQYSALQQAMQNLNDGTSDEMLANDVDRMITVASQQLRLAGNVNNAVVALESAQARLARADRPRFASLQQAINGDLDRLRAVSTVDIPAVSGRIERLVTLVGRAPLIVPDTAAPDLTPQSATRARSMMPAPATEPLPADAPWWQRWRAELGSWPGRAGAALTNELGDLIRVQRVDQPAALLLSTDQAADLRSVLHQRLLSLQLAMLMRQPAVWKSELDNISDTLTKYFDPRSPETQAALSLTRDLAQTDIAVRVPDVADSLNGIAALRAAGFKSDEQD
ncbi:heme biosynthesis operon protein HemX [Bordetella holmesii]|uniref:Protein HemX n=2 Tax=Bordetella holmesii TaxID=35814 RepID=A0A158M3K3_9BORD|nr:uroporphyrinogen-III C-methyltransferase [Bordetella holmesii]AMD46566.1 heme biosynthesis operon protein HemX [Bordetella holmesii H558]KAK80115.1 protein HemX [Bordetella holmesii CDC-H809-BH]KAK80942.1 protein HemX [Bordetella holmesii CDC-H572-BH]KAK90019.1 protein HemX [Bordetella holmesii CDC-H635-BH]KAK90421.1 protein HemX [Bordetella holmesii CDC-H585-BH]KCV03529.1 protein HemX [Bordetella holmesii CDC-H719-BH]KCV07858.1 protein HemX [Bordetella holmesii CDC-H629-BH]KCV09938.1 pr